MITYTLTLAQPRLAIVDTLQSLKTSCAVSAYARAVCWSLDRSGSAPAAQSSPAPGSGHCRCPHHAPQHVSAISCGPIKVKISKHHAQKCAAEPANQALLCCWYMAAQYRAFLLFVLLLHARPKHGIIAAVVLLIL